MLRLIFFIAFIIALDIYAYQAFRFLVKGRWGTILYFLITLFIIGGMIYQFSTGGRRNMSPLTQFFIVSFVILIVCKLVIIATMFGEDIFRLIKGGVNKLTGNTQGGAIPSRRKF
ncbi:MAG: metallophosphoesterase, partial [Dokdonia donghaensis]|nr:metallophosphoesterase [Dokdonia donghaensis]